MNLNLTKTTYRAGSEFSDLDDSHIAPEGNPPVLTASSYSGALTPSDNGAGGQFTLVPSFTDKWEYVPANRSRIVTLTVTDSIGPVDITLDVKATWPINPHQGYEFDTPSNSKVIVAKDETPRFRRMPKRSAVWTDFFLNRTIRDVSVAKDFEKFHDIDIEFYYIDPELVQTILVRLDSSVRVKIDGANNFEMSCIFKVYRLSEINIPTEYT